jgi:CheY-like chemotaxis protein
MTKVLLADESVTIQKVVDLVLSEEGYEIKAVSSGEEALATMASFTPDIVLADIKLKGKNGYEIARSLKGNPATTQVPVLLLAGAFDPVNEDLLMQSGADGSLTKPFESGDLLDKIRSLTGGQAAPAQEAEEPAFAFEEEAQAAAPVFDIGAEAAAPVFDVGGEAASSAPVASAVEGEDLWELGDFGNVAEADEAVEAFEAEAVVSAVAGEPPAASAAVGASQATAAELSGAVGEAVTAGLEELVQGIDLKAIIAEIVAPTVRDTVEKILWEVTPELTEKLLREAVNETLGSLNKDLENIIWETVPELAESIIRKEIDKIRAEG